MIKNILAVVLAVTSLTANAACSDLYPEPINVLTATELCNSFFVSLYDKSKNTVVVVSEKIPGGTTFGTERVNAFHSDSRIKLGPIPNNYAGTGYDKGHMAPAGDATGSDQMYETFLMTNMTPQEPTLNRTAWAHLEEAVRKEISKATGDVYIVTIAQYDSHPKLMNNIPIPNGYWKITYMNNTKTFYYAPNVPHAQVIKKPPVAINSLLK